MLNLKSLFLSLVLAIFLVLGLADVANAAGPCPGGLYQCEVKGEKTCNCPPIGSHSMREFSNQFQY
jgi:hypothetical protein